MALDDIASARAEYTRGGLVESDLAADPFVMFERWYDEAHTAGIHEPNAMVVATASASGVPAARFVLLKGCSPEGFVFFTNTGSRKGEELAANPACALLFPWHPIERQVRVDGTASLLPRKAVDDYFGVRPRGSQIGAWASRQSRVV
jgi:pyridoxamine 5'-phosphate oxidase